MTNPSTNPDTRLSDERVATLCSEWPNWLRAAVTEAIELADAKDWSTEQVVGYAFLAARSAHPLRNQSPSDREVGDYEIAHMVKAAKKKAPTYWSEVRDADIVWIKVIRAAVAALQSSSRGQP